MRKRSGKPRKRPPADANEAAFDAMLQLTGGTPSGKNPFAVALGRLGGKKGGPARARKLTPKQRSASARKAAIARWKRRPI